MQQKFVDKNGKYLPEEFSKFIVGNPLAKDALDITDMLLTGKPTPGTASAVEKGGLIEWLSKQFGGTTNYTPDIAGLNRAWANALSGGGGAAAPPKAAPHAGAGNAKLKALVNDSIGTEK
jgi:hypothetical protein